MSLTSHAFNTPPSFVERARNAFTPETHRVVEDGGVVGATMRFLPFAHFYGGRAVSAAGISAVAVSAEARGAGLGTLLMRETLAELRAGGTAISSLYPATVNIYRKAGYGFGGIRTTWKVRLVHLPSARNVSLVAFGDDEALQLNAAYERIAAETNGLIRRDEKHWRTRVLQSRDEKPSYRYLVREDGDVTGWIIYGLTESKDSWRSTMSCRDLFWRTPDAARALLSLASLHRSTCEYMEWTGPPAEPLADLLIEDPVENRDSFRWMVRLLDLPGAIETRGYNPLIEATVLIGARDPMFSENEGPWLIDVSGGAAKVSRAERADAIADVQTWASIWSSLLRPRDAVRLGALSATERALDTLEAIFAGPLPWLADFY